MQALRSIEQYLGLEKLYVLGTNCVDNGPRKGLDTFLKAASKDPDTVLHYEFMQARVCGVVHCRKTPGLEPVMEWTLNFVALLSVLH